MLTSAPAPAAAQIPPTPTVTVTADYSRVYEGASAVFTFHAEPAPTADLTVSYTTSDQQPHRAWRNQRPASGTVTIPSGQTSVTLTVPATNRLVYTATYTGDGEHFSCQNGRKYTADSLVYEVMHTPAQTFPEWKADQTYDQWKATNSADPAPAPSSEVQGHWLYKEIVAKGSYATTAAKWAVYDEVSFKCTRIVLSTKMGEIGITLAAGSGYTLGSAATAKTAVRDKSLKDSDGIEASFGAAAYGLEEGNAQKRTVTIPVNLAQAHATDDLTVSFTISGTAAVPTAGNGNGIDYALRPAPTGSVTIPQGSTSADITVTLVDDSVVEGSETIVLELLSGTGIVVGTTSTATVTVADNDVAPTAMALSVAPTTVAEDAGATPVKVIATLQAHPSPVFATDTTVTVSVDGSGGAGRVGFAAVADFDITIAAGSRTGSGSFTLTPTDDSLDNDDETVTVSGSSSGFATVTAATISLTDDETPPPPGSVTVSRPAVTVTEAAGAGRTAAYTVVLGAAPTADVAITVATGDASIATVHKPGGTAGASATLAFTSTNWNQAQTVTVTGVDDSVDQSSNRTTAISHSASSSDARYGGISIRSVSVTVADDDVTVVNPLEIPQQLGENPGQGSVGGATPGTQRVVEVVVSQDESRTIGIDESAQFSITLESLVTRPVRLFIEIDGEATVGSDYEVDCQFPDDDPDEWVSLGDNPRRLVIEVPQGEREVTVRVTSQDQREDGAETPLVITIGDRSYALASVVKLDPQGEARITLVGADSGTDEPDTDEAGAAAVTDEGDGTVEDPDDGTDQDGASDEAEEPGADEGQVEIVDTPIFDDTLRYTVQRSDTLSSIARRIYLDNEFSQVIWGVNRDRRQNDGWIFHSPDLIRAGWELAIPTPIAIPASGHAATADYAVYTVQGGDTLGRIAERVYGDAACWTLISAANTGRRQIDGRTFTSPDAIRPDWQLRIPLAGG